MKAKTTVGWSEPTIFLYFRSPYLRKLFELKPILLCSAMKCLMDFPVTLKCLTLNDPEMSFYAESCGFHRRFD